MICIEDREFSQLAEYIQNNYGINFSRKRHLIEGRLNKLLQERGFDSFSKYLHQLFTDSSKVEITTLLNRLTTNHTFFMREGNHFDYLRDEVLPFLETAACQKDLRIWSAGCSSGEEAYTLAMVLADYFGHEKSNWNTKILATDISVRVLEKAKKGVYSAEGIGMLPPAWKLNYFRKSDQLNFQVSNQIKDDVIYRVFNLMDDVFPFKKRFQVIFCRNVMIYFDHKIQEQLIGKFYGATEPGGYLFIGHSESLGRNQSSYKYIIPGVYRKE